MQLSLTATMPLRIPFCESRGLHVLMELLPFGPPCDYFPVLPCTRYRAYQREIQYDQVYSGYSGVRVPSKFLQRWWNQLQYLGCIGWLALKAVALPHICPYSASQCLLAGLQLGDLTCHWVSQQAQQKGSLKECVHRWWFSSDMEWLTTRPNSSKMVSKRWPPTTTAARWHKIELLKMAAL